MMAKIKKYATDLIACGKDAGESFYGEQLFNEKGLIIKNGIDLNKYRFNEQIRTKIREEFGFSDKIVIGSVSRIADVKNHSYLLKIASQLINYKLDFIFLIVGEGPLLQSLKEKCKELGLLRYFVFLGSRNDVHMLLQGIDIFVLPSLHEGLPVTLVEAQATGLPCIISSNVTRELQMTKNISFLNIGEENVESWCNEIIKYSYVTRNTDLNNLINEGYDISDSCQNLAKIYKKAINAR